MITTHVTGNPIERGTMEALVKAGHDAPTMMLNLNRYSKVAAFPEGRAYLKYVSLLDITLDRLGAKVLWKVPVHGQFIGCEHDEVDEILAIWYPSVSAFLMLLELEGCAELWESRKQCVTHAIIHRCPGNNYPMTPSDVADVGDANLD